MKRALMYASVASMIDLFNMNNIKILKELGYEVDVACNFEDGSITSDERVSEFRKELIELGIKTYNIPIPRNVNKFNDIRESYRLTLKLAKEKEYDLVHCHSPIGSVICRWAFRKSKTRMIYTAHGFHFFSGAPIKSWILYYPIERLMAKYTDTLITINQEDFKRAQKFRVREKVVLTNGIGVDLSKFSPKSNLNRYELFKNIEKIHTDFLMVSVGQLSIRKNHRMIIEAISQLENKKIKYLIVGDGELRETLNNMIREKKLENQVFLLGYKENVNDYLSVADVYAFPSLQEGLPASLMEAMSCGLPCIVSNIRGNNDLITNNKGGYLFELNDITFLMNSIHSLMLDKEKRKKFGKFNEEIVENFSKETVHKQMLEIYNDVK